jgi:hypothetical protein
MAILKPRSRLVYYRISEEEYERLTCLCKAGAARSLSDFTRQAVQRLMEENANVPDSHWGLKLKEIEGLIVQLRRMLAQLAQLNPQALKQLQSQRSPGFHDGRRSTVLEEAESLHAESES